MPPVNFILNIVLIVLVFEGVFIRRLMFKQLKIIISYLNVQKLFPRKFNNITNDIASNSAISLL